VPIWDDLELGDPDASKLPSSTQIAESATIGCWVRRADFQHRPVFERYADDDVTITDGNLFGLQHRYRDDTSMIDAENEVTFAQ